MTLQTLGRRHSLRGVLVLGAIEPLDPARTDIINSVIGLASLALEQARTLDTARRHLRSGVFEQLLAGNTDVAARTARQVWGQLPGEPVLVTVASLPGRASTCWKPWNCSPMTTAARCSTHSAATNIVVLANPAHQHKVVGCWERHGASRRSLGADGLRGPAERPEEGGQSAGGAERAVTRRGRVFGSRRRRHAGPARGRKGRVGGPRAAAAADQARRRGADTAAGDRPAWLANNCVWDSTARRLGVHRHTLRNRIDAAGRSWD